MDTGNGSHPNGNGSADPSAESPKSVSPAGSEGHPPELLVALEHPAESEVPRDERGRIKKGHSLNPKGRTPGIPNRNTELVRILNTTELREAWALAKKQAAKGDSSLMAFMLDRVFLKQTPEAAGIVINNAPQAHAHHTENHVRLGEHLSDAGTRDAVAELTQRLASRGAFAGDSRHVRQ